MGKFNGFSWKSQNTTFVHTMRDDAQTIGNGACDRLWNCPAARIGSTSHRSMTVRSYRVVCSVRSVRMIICHKARPLPRRGSQWREGVGSGRTNIDIINGPRKYVPRVWGRNAAPIPSRIRMTATKVGVTFMKCTAVFAVRWWGRSKVYTFEQPSNNGGNCYRYTRLGENINEDDAVLDAIESYFDMIGNNWRIGRIYSHRSRPGGGVNLRSYIFDYVVLHDARTHGAGTNFSVYLKRDKKKGRRFSWRKVRGERK